MRNAHSDILMACFIACEICASECIKLANENHMRCIQLCRDCAELCQLCGRFEARGSEFGNKVMKLCAELCTACAEECEKFAGHDHCIECAALCRRCAEMCSEH